jgi:hypothetical protein
MVTMALSVFVAAFLASCSGKSESGINAGTSVQDPALSITDSTFKDSVWEKFTNRSDSLLQHYDLRIRTLRQNINEPKNRVHMAKKRRDVIQVEYKLEKLQERLHNRDCDYKAAIEISKKFPDENAAFIKEYNKSLKELDRKIIAMYKDTIR